MNLVKKWVPQRILKNSPLLLFMALGLLLIIPLSNTNAVTDDVCANCHTDISETFHNTAHGVYFSQDTKLANHTCEACHGSGTAHIEDGDSNKIINPAKHDQFGGNVLCLNCHKSHKFDNWSFSAHKTNNVTCADCHKVHGDASMTTKEKSPDLCYKCHSDVKISASMPSHHPIAEGKMKCEDCHGVHGEPAKLTMDKTGRELCLSCHPDKEGPFVYEHAPVEEDCLICHTPHGSVADNLLKQSEPSLCLSCHPMHFHATVVSVDGAYTTPQAPERAGVSTPDGWKKGMLTKCTQCHTEVHGSDLPSQTISTGGDALTR
ncbi:MAG: DmsE family decaheme c-type cytochrome [FCB group bacterium]|nr:DmsE family decaheme c-type cytochrome [FCB group bacterium]